MYRNLRTDDALSNTGPDLTPQNLIRLTRFAVPEQLQPLFSTVTLLECDEHQINDTLPAAVGFFSVVLQGSGALHFAGGRVDPAPLETLLAPTNAAVGLVASGPLRMLAVPLSPLGWMALTGRDAAKWADRADDAVAVLGDGVRGLGDRLRAEWLAGARTGPSFAVQHLADVLVDHLATLLRPLDPDHVQLARTVTDWLSSSFDPALADLQAQVDYSPRQLQRLITRYFGCGPKQLMRKYRALRVAALLQAPDLPDDRLAQLCNLFYDQSHMIREIRHFTGRTPQRLIGAGESVLAAASGLENYTRIKPNVARIPGD